MEWAAIDKVVYTVYIRNIYRGSTMTFYVRDKATDTAVRRLAKRKNKTLTDTIREAVENEYRRTREKIPLEDRLDELAREFSKYPRTGLDADKGFFDKLSSED